MQLARAVLVLGALACSNAIAAPAAGEICDTGDRIFVVDARPHGRKVVAMHGATTALTGTVTVISRKTYKSVQAPLASGSMYTDDCGGTAGGHAGCSFQSGSTIKSRVLGKDVLFLGDSERRMLIHDDADTECRDIPPWIAACSTRSWFAVVVQNGDHEVIRLTDTDEKALADDVISSVGGGHIGTRAEVWISKRGGMVKLDGKRESCVAVYRHHASGRATVSSRS